MTTEDRRRMRPTAQERLESQEEAGSSLPWSPWRELDPGDTLSLDRGALDRERVRSSPAAACGAASRQPRGTKSPVTPAPAFSAGGRVELTHVMGFCENQVRTARTGCVVVTDSGVDVLNRQHPQVLTKHGRLIFVTTQGAGGGGCHCALFTGGQPEAYSQGPGPAGGAGGAPMGFEPRGAECSTCLGPPPRLPPGVQPQSWGSWGTRRGHRKPGEGLSWCAGSTYPGQDLALEILGPCPPPRPSGGCPWSGHSPHLVDGKEAQGR